jgi:hypothetical protein
VIHGILKNLRPSTPLESKNKTSTMMRKNIQVPKIPMVIQKINKKLQLLRVEMLIIKLNVSYLFLHIARIQQLS